MLGCDPEDSHEIGANDVFGCAPTLELAKENLGDSGSQIPE